MSGDADVTNGGTEYAPMETDATVNDAEIASSASSEEDAAEQASIPMTCLNMACNILGGAILALPSAMHNASIVWGMLLLVFTAVMSTFAMAMLTLCAHKLQKFTYKEILAIGLNEKIGKAFEGVLFLYTFGVLVEYARIIADSMPQAVGNLFHASGVWVQPWFWLVVAFFMFFGLSSMKALSELTWSSVLGFVTIFYIVIIVAVRYFDKSQRTEVEQSDGKFDAEDVNIAELGMDLLETVPVLAMSFSCHYNIPAFYRELKHRSLERMKTAVLFTMPNLAILYSITGIFGYLSFGDKRLKAIHGDVVVGYANDDLAVNIGRLGLFFHFVCVYPIVAIGCRRCLNTLLFGNPDQAQRIYVIEAFFLVSVSCTFAYFVSGIAVVIEIIGSLFGIQIVFVLPALMYIRIYNPNFRAPGEEEEDLHVHFQGAGEVVMDNGSLDSQLLSNGSDIEIPQPDGSVAVVHRKPQQHNHHHHHNSVSLATKYPLPNKYLFRLAYCFVVGGSIMSIASFSLTLKKIFSGES